MNVGAVSRAAPPLHAVRSLPMLVLLGLGVSTSMAAQVKTPPKPAPIVSPSAVPTAPPQADLQVISFQFFEWEKCPGPASGAFPKFRVKVRNGGTASSRAGILLQVADEHFPAWNHSQGLPSLGAGQETQQVVMLSPSTDRTHADGAAPHPFVAIVDPDHTVVDPRPANNRSAVVNVGRPCPTPEAAPVSGGSPGTVIPPIPQAAPVSGGQPGTVQAVPPSPAPVSGGEVATVQPTRAERRPIANLALEPRPEEAASHGECDGGWHVSPVFYLYVFNRSLSGPRLQVTLRAIDPGRPVFVRDTVLPLLGPREYRFVSWKVPIPRELRYDRSDIVREFTVTVDPDERFDDPDRRDNALRLSKILIFCRDD